MIDVLIDGSCSLPRSASRATVMDVIEGEVGDGPYLFGDWFTAADVMISSMFMWARLWGNATGRPRLEAYVDRLQARPHAMKMKS
ncbi:glutathione S-transferase C-terminal domain-containing protein [Sorangium sp. So ce1504]|uniref:glutathione S-transferase family protein n=2 Tax=unclassified Sorangium TaxID=2621164 RepID=UPI003F5F25B0